MLRKVKNIGKKAAKYKFVASLSQLDVQGTKSWQPHKLVVAWTRKKKRVSASAQSWRPSIKVPYKGHVTWSGQNQEALPIQVTLFQDVSQTGYEPKYWVVVLENEARDGKRKAIATVRLNMADYVMEVPSPRQIELQFKPLTRKVASASLALTLTCDFLSVGPATESDMMSTAGSTTSEDTIRLGNIDVADVADFDDRDFPSSRSSSTGGRSKDSFSVTQQEFRNLTSQIESLSHSIDTPPALPVNDQDADISDIQNESNTSNPSRKSSLASEHSERTSVSNKHQCNIRQSISEGDEAVEVNEDNEAAGNRDSVISDSSDSSLQKRRLRPSVDFLPSHHPHENNVSSLQGSPAPHIQKSLLRWCQKVTASHKGVKVTNFTTSWRNGLALCAVLHHYKPSLIDYESLNGLDWRKNCQKAIQGFESASIQDWSKVDVSIISDKNKLISLLALVKNSFEPESPQKEEIGSGDNLVSSEASTTSIPAHKTISSNPAFLGLSNATRVQLLSDLEEKECEDDVFSAAVDEVLETQRSSCIHEDSSHHDEVSNKSEDVVESPVHEQSLSCAKKSPSSPSISVIPNKSTSSALPIDIVLASLQQEETADALSTKEDSEVDKTVSKVAVGSGPNSPISPVIKNDFKKSEIDSGNPVSEDTSFTIKPNDPVQPNLEPLNPFAEDEEKESVNEPEFFLQIHLPASNSTPGPQQPQSFKHDLSDSLLANSSNVVVCENESNHSQGEVESPASADTEEESNTLSKEDSLDVSVKLSLNGDDKKSKDEDFQATVNKLLESSAARSKKAKTLELIEKAKAEVAVGGSEPVSEKETKRQKEVKERAKRLIEETRATLDRTRKRDNPVGYSTSAKSVSISDESDSISSPVASQDGPHPTVTTASSNGSTSFCFDTVTSNNANPCTSTPLPKSSLDLSSTGGIVELSAEAEQDEVILSSASSKHVDVPDLVPELLQNDVSSSINAENAIPLINTSINAENAIPLINNHASLENSMDRPDAVMRRRNIRKDTTVSHSDKEIPTPSSPLQEKRVPPLSHPLSDVISTESQPPTNGDVGFSHPLEELTTTVHTSHTANKSDASTDPTPKANQSSSEDATSRPTATVIERLSIASVSDLQKRLSVVLRKKSPSTSVANGANEISAEKLALEAEQKHVEERATEVQLELQQLKASGRRANKAKEADLMQEWFQLVNKKNAILRQQDQLILMEEEQAIVEREEKLQEELIPLMAIEDSMKTQSQRDREHVLLQEKFQLVNERDRIMQDMNEKEQIALEEDEHFQTNLGENMSKVIQSDEKCLVM